MFHLRFRDLFDNTAANLAGGYTLAQIIMNIGFAALCGLVIYLVYKKTYSGVLFSKNVGVTLVIVTIVTSLIVMAIHGNLALSLGMIGALSIVRFRTPIKDPKDLAFLFWSVSAGVICGISAYKLAVIGVGFVGVCLFLLSRRVTWADPYLLVVKGKADFMGEVRKLLQAQCQKSKERSSSMSADAAEVVYEVVLKKTTSIELLAKINMLSGIDKAMMVSYDGDLDESR